jgi:hypothetical protein
VDTTTGRKTAFVVGLGRVLSQQRNELSQALAGPSRSGIAKVAPGGVFSRRNFIVWHVPTIYPAARDPDAGTRYVVHLIDLEQVL